MSEQALERYAWMAGILSVVLFVVATFIAGTPPNPNDSVQKVFNYVQGNPDALRWGGFIVAIGIVLFAFWLAALTGVVRRSLQGPSGITTLVIVGGVVGLTLALVGIAIANVEVLRIHQLGPNGVYFFFGLGYLLAAVGNFGTAVLVGAVALAGVRGTALPSWFVAISGALAVGFLVAGIGVATFRSEIATVGLVVFLVWALWIVAISVLMLRQSQARAT
jgi:hypothetical protein